MVAFALTPCVGAQASRDFISPAIEALDDPSGTLGIDDVSRGPAARRFSPLEKLPEVHSFRSVTRWYRFAAPQTQTQTGPLVLQTTAEDGELYSRRADGTLATARFGMTVPFAERSYKSADPTVLLPGDVARPSFMYVRMHGPSLDLDIVPALRDYAERYGKDRRLFAFLGMIGTVGIISLVLALYLRSRAYALNAAAQAALILYIMTYSDLAWEYFWPKASFAWLPIFELTANLSLLATFLFVRSFLSLRSELPWLDRLLWGAVAVVWIQSFLATSIFPENVTLGAILYRTTWFLLVLAALLRARTDRGARYLASGLGALAITLLLHALQETRSVTDMGPILNFIANAPYLVGGTIDALMFQCALADRSMVASRERIALQGANITAQQELLETRANAVARLEKYNAAFGHFVPRDFLKRLGREDVTSVALGDHVEREMAVLFCDIRSFTTLSESMSPEQNFAFINAYLERIGPVIRQHGGFIDKYIGDAIMALFDDAAPALDAAIALHSEVRRFNEALARTLRDPIAVGVGIHWGRLMLGTVGDSERFEATVISDAVNVASRLEGLTKMFGADIIVSEAVMARVEGHAAYHARRLGQVRLRGTSRNTTVFEVCDGDTPELLLHKMATSELFETALAAYADGNFARSGELFGAILERNARDFPAAYFEKQSKATLRAGAPSGWDGVERRDA